ncbi:class I SAM-dependent methyltransferase [bacterium]|nr:class I SAM-dependent methyltransferase [bacterium]
MREDIMSIAKLTSGLTAGEHGILTSSKSASLSYSEGGNLNCFQLEDKSFWFIHRNDCIASVIKRFPPDGTVLDVGGGNGFVTKRILDEGFDAALLEPGETGALNGKVSRHIPEVICSPLEDAGFPPSSLSAVGCFDVIEHIESDHAFLMSVHGLLKSGGILYVTVPAHQWLWSLSDDTAGHYRRYNKNMVGDLLTSKFEILYFTYFFRVITLPIFIFRTLPFRLHPSRKKKVLSSESEHGTTGGATVAVFKHFLRKELAAIQRGKSRQFGSSCLFVARKISSQQIAPDDTDMPIR